MNENENESSTPARVETIAKTVHEVFRALYGDISYPPWEEFDPEEKKLLISDVKAFIAGESSSFDRIELAKSRKIFHAVCNSLVGVLNDLGKEILLINKQNGWNTATPESWEEELKIPAMLALITSETSEALEAFRENNKENFAEECADQIIRVLDLTTGLGLDIDKAVSEKLAKNRLRGFRHGGKKV